MKIDKASYLEHIKDNEQIIMLRNLLDKIERVIGKHSIEHTDFLDPYQRRLCKSILNRFQEISFHEEGGYEEAERKLIVVYPNYIERSDIDSLIGVIEIGGKFKFTDVTHRDYLGAILGLGIKREKIGDIHVHKKLAHVIINKDISEYILLNLKTIRKESVNVKEVDIGSIIQKEEEYRDISTTVASLRLDSILSAAINISRSESTKMINNGKVKVNWEPINQPSYEMSEGDLASVRGYGRFRLYKVLGISKKERVKIIFRRYE